MGIMEYLKKKKSTMTPMDILREKAELSKKKDACNCVFCQNNDDIKNIKMVFVQLDRFTEEKTGTKMISGLINESPVYKIPNDMPLEDVSKVLSYINEIIEANFEIDYDTLECQEIIQANLPNYGFIVDKDKNEEMQKQRLERKKIEDEKASKRSPYITRDDTQEYISDLLNFDPYKPTTELLKVDNGKPMNIPVNKISNTVNLFVVNGEWDVFKHSDAYPLYANWFTPFVGTSEVQDIYQKSNLTLPRAPMPNTNNM